MTDSLPTPVWSGSFTVFGVEVKCHVLDNGQRIIEAGSLEQLLDAMAYSDVLAPGDLRDFAQWQRGILQ